MKNIKHTDTTWTNKYPSQKILREEIDCMINCFKEELFSKFEKKEIIGIYLLGSVNKNWDSNIDYIPGMSDVDLNVYVRNPRKVEKYFADMSTALSFAKNCEKKFIKKIPKSEHIPRLQAQLHNMFLEQYPDSLAPASSVKTIYGLDYKKCIPANIPKDVNHQKQIVDSKKRILSDQNYVLGIPLRVMSANSDRLIRYLNEIYYKSVSATTQVLCIEGVDKETAMCLNKTSVIQNLESLGQTKLSIEYHSMLKNAYAYSVNKDIGSVHKAILSGYHVLDLSIKIAQKKK